MSRNRRPCSHENVILTGRGECLYCKRERFKEWRIKNLEYNKARCKEWRENRSEEKQQRDNLVARVRASDWKRKNPGRVRELNSKPSYKEKHKLVARKWSARNPAKRCADSQRRNARKIQATPAWADYELIIQKYKLANKLTS